MNPNFRLAALIAASLGLIISLYMALSPGGDETAAPATTAVTATVPVETAPPETDPAETESEPAEAVPDPEAVLELEVVVGADGVAEVERFKVRLDRKLRLVVRSELADHVHLHGYDLMEDVGPNAPATIEFTATAPGRFEIELEDRGLEIAELEVQSLSLIAHGIGGVRDLPVPDWLFFWGAAVVLVLSFLALGALWRKPQLDRRAAGTPLPEGLERMLRSTALRVVLGAVSAALLVVVFLAALVGENSASQNIAPTWVYVVFWLGLVPVQIVLGNVWAVLNPWRAIADAVAWAWRRLGLDWTPPLSLPERLGVLPAAFLLFLWAALELTYSEPASPRALALAIALYSYAMWFGMAAFGRREWTARGDAFSVYFGLLARIAPFGERDGRLVRRVPFTGLVGDERTPGMLAFVAVMLGSVGYDGLSRAPFWQDLRAELEGPYVIDSPGTAELVATALGLAGLVGCVLLVAGAYLLAIRGAHAMLEHDRPLAASFLQSLVPIALVYAVAHYFTLLVIQGQYAIPLASDPFGYGWDLFGTVDYAPDISPFSPNTVWYVQVGSLVAGHVAGLAVAHDRAVTLLPERDALRSQYAMLALMVLYTVGGLWLLSNG